MWFRGRSGGTTRVRKTNRILVHISRIQRRGSHAFVKVRAHSGRLPDGWLRYKRTGRRVRRNSSTALCSVHIQAHICLSTTLATGHRLSSERGPAKGQVAKQLLWGSGPTGSASPSKLSVQYRAPETHQSAAGLHAVQGECFLINSKLSRRSPSADRSPSEILSIFSGSATWPSSARALAKEKATPIIEDPV